MSKPSRSTHFQISSWLYIPLRGTQDLVNGATLCSPRPTSASPTLLIRRCFQELWVPFYLLVHWDQGPRPHVLVFAMDSSTGNMSSIGSESVCHTLYACPQRVLCGIHFQISVSEKRHIPWKAVFSYCWWLTVLPFFALIARKHTVETKALLNHFHGTFKASICGFLLLQNYPVLFIFFPYSILPLFLLYTFILNLFFFLEKDRANT